MLSVKIAVDCMGGDNAPKEIVKGCVEALKTGDDKLILVGVKSVIEAELGNYNYDKSRIEIVEASEVIGTDEVPTVAIRKKKNSSMVVGLNLVKAGKADSFISAGNTGALLTGATVIVGRIKGVERPCLATLFPTEKGRPALLLDVGANTDCKPSYLVQFAHMGSIYFENVMGTKNPRVGIINIGVEEEKGDQLTKEAHQLLKETDLNFIGNVEARDIMKRPADVMVCDGFVGNIILKFGEGMANTLFHLIKQAVMERFLSKIGALLCLGALKDLAKTMDYTDVNGAPFLGLNALVVKAHGASDSKAIVGAVNMCRSFIKNDIVNKIKEKM